jgi:CDP-glucose 4,6-dehydratase
VIWIVERMAHTWGEGASWRLDAGEHPHEAHHLKLDTSKARNRLSWRPKWTLDTALYNVTQWHRAWHGKRDMQQVCLEQIEQYISGISEERV